MGSLIPLFLLGYYGFGNWGDELSLLATLRVLEDMRKARGFPFTYHVLSGNPALPLPLPEGCSVVPRRAVGKVFRTFLWSSFVIVGGGSLLQDVTSFRSLLYYGAFLALAEGMRKSTVFFGCGLGPFTRKVSERIVRWLLRNSGLFLARDEETLRFLKSSGAPSVSLMADPVFLLWNGEEACPSSRVAVFLRKQAWQRVEALFKEFRRLQREGVELEFAAFHRDEDWDVTSFFGERLQAPYRYFTSIEEVYSYFRGLGGVLSMRFHPLVLATCFGIPWGAFDVDPKIRSLSMHWSGENLFALSGSGDGVLSRFLQSLEDLKEETLRLREVFVQRAQEGKRELENFFLRVLERL